MNIDLYILSFFQGKITLEEYAELKRWFNASDENRNYFRETILILKATTPTKEHLEFDTDKAFREWEARYLLKQTLCDKKSKRFSLPLIAASIALFLSFSGVLTGYLLASHKNIVENNLYCIETPANSRTNIILPDGSTIQMNAGSRIQYNSSFGKKSREVIFEGEGFFEIETDASKPFLVRLPEHTVEVLGTKFNLKSYLNDDLTQIALLEGAVRINQLSGPEQPVYLKPSEQYKYDKNQPGYSISSVKPANITGWTNGKLFFDNQSLKDIVNQLERIYNRKIIIQSETLQNKIFYSDFETNQPLEDILKILSAGDKFKYTIHSTHIEMYN